MDNTKNEFERDFVYVPVNARKESSFGEEFESVKLRIFVQEPKMQLYIYSDKAVDQLDLEHILRSLANGMLKKMRVDIYKDCAVFYHLVDETYKIILNPSDGTIDMLELVFD